MSPTVEEMFANSELDGVLIAVPTPQHIDTTRQALEAGVPVLCEKPFGLVPEAARELGNSPMTGAWRCRSPTGDGSCRS